VEIKVYSKSNCSWCDALRTFMNKKGVAYTEIKIDAAIENLEELRMLFPEAKTVPQMFVDDVRIGGYEASIRYFNEEEKTDVV